MITVTIEVHVLHPQTSWVSRSSSHTYETDKARTDQSGSDGDASSLPTLGLTALHGRTCERSLPQLLELDSNSIIISYI